MLQQLQAFVVALTALGAAYGAYALTTPLWLSPPPITRVGAKSRPVVAFASRREFAHLFPEGAWELGTVKRIENRQATLLFGTDQALDATTLEIRPCTMILYVDGDSPEDASARPIVLQAPEGAKLRFQDSVDLTRGQFGAIIGGEMRGPVHVFSPESRPGADDAMELDTRNVSLERKRIETQHDVDLRIGPNRVVGAVLKIDLAPSPAGGAGVAVGGIERIELAEVQEVRLTPKPQVAAGELPAPAIPVVVTCERGFVFDVAKQTATFLGNVKALRENPKGSPDQLRGEKLTAFFSGPRQEPAAARGSASERLLPGGEVVKIAVTGSPAAFDSEAFGAQARADDVLYDLIERKVALETRRAGVDVVVRHGDREFVAPAVHCRFTEDGRLTELWGAGPGRMRSVTNASGRAEETPVELSVAWRKDIRIRPQDGNQLVSLREGVQLSHSRIGAFRANEMHFWLIELARPTRPRGRLSEPSARAQTPPMSVYKLDRMKAEGKVRVESPQLNLDVATFEAWFHMEPGSLGEGPTDAPNERSSPRLRGPGERPSVAGQPQGIREPARTADASRQFHATGERVRMQFVEARGEMLPDEFAIEGKPVKIREVADDLEMAPLSIVGRAVQMTDGASGRGVFHIFGVETAEGPRAVVAAQGTTLKAPQLHLSQRDNRLWADEPGSMTLPLERDMNGRPLTTPQEAVVVWKKAMDFDGRVARLRGGATIDSETQHAEADQMHVVLTAPIDFTRGAQRPSGAAPDVGTILLSGKVFLENRGFDDQGGPESLERMTLEKSLRIERASGDIVGEGPGWLSMVRKGGVDVSTIGPDPRRPRADHEVVGRDQKLTYLRVDFTDKLRGNLNERTATFGERVDAIYGPVQDWTETLSVERREGLGSDGVLLGCQSLAVRQMPTVRGVPGGFELEASGNVHAEGRDYTANARRLSYVSSKGQFVLEGDGTGDAEVRHHRKDAYASAKKILYNHLTDELEWDSVRTIDFGPIGNQKSAPSPKPASPRDFRSRR